MLRDSQFFFTHFVKVALQPMPLLHEGSGAIEPRAYIRERYEEPSARRERVVVPFRLERRRCQVRRDDVQM